MLVLSRRQNDKVVFPHLGITLEILRISGSSVRVGINAPADVTVLRHELADPAALAEANSSARTWRHEIHNRLNTANLCLHLMQRQMDLGRLADAERTLEKALQEFSALDREVAAAGQSPVLHPPKPTHRALLVEDDTNESELLAGYLRMSGFEVDTASDGGLALDYLSTTSRRPDIVLLDMVMPRCDGPTTVSAIRNNPRFEGLKIIAVSGSEPSEVNVIIGPRGVDYWFAKPINPQKLVSQLQRCLVEEAVA